MSFFFQMVEMTVTVTTAMAKLEKLDLFPKTSQHVRCLSCFASTRDLLNIDNNLLNEVEDDQLLLHAELLHQVFNLTL